MVGFVYEADRKAIQDAQDRLDELQHQELLNKIDDAIDAIEDLKKTNNIYNYEGTATNSDAVGLGPNATTVTWDGITSVISALTAANYTAPDISAILADVGEIANGVTAATGNVSLNIGDIVLNGVNDTETLADNIINNLPNALMQRLYKN